MPRSSAAGYFTILPFLSQKRDEVNKIVHRFGKRLFFCQPINIYKGKGFLYFFAIQILSFCTLKKICNFKKLLTNHPENVKLSKS